LEALKGEKKQNCANVLCVLAAYFIATGGNPTMRQQRFDELIRFMSDIIDKSNRPQSISWLRVRPSNKPTAEREGSND
jgi:hypothetical protein